MRVSFFDPRLLPQARGGRCCGLIGIPQGDSAAPRFFVKPENACIETEGLLYLGNSSIKRNFSVWMFTIRYSRSM